MSDAPAADEGPSPAEKRAARRANQTTFNLILALAASLLIVLFLVVVVVRPDVQRPAVDATAIGAEAQRAVDVPLVVPELPAGWSANRAELVTSAADGVTRWEIGILTAKKQYIGLVQGLDANPTWLASEVAGATPAGGTRIGGIEWIRFDRRDVDDPGNLAFALVAEGEESTVVLGGTADEDEFEQLAALVAEEWR